MFFSTISSMFNFGNLEGLVHRKYHEESSLTSPLIHIIQKKVVGKLKAHHITQYVSNQLNLDFWNKYDYKCLLLHSNNQSLLNNCIKINIILN